MKQILVLTGFVLGANVAVSAAPVVLRSGPARVALVELYTSEGCSSCPPAEKWLGELRGDSGLWRDFVPVAFHVNYWDHLGWRDALAAKTFTERQRRYATAWGASSVYTPGFVRNGTEWRPQNRSASGRPAAQAGTLTITWNASDATGTVEYIPSSAAAKPKSLEVSVALLGGGIVSHVRKGENAGRELRHEFVVLRLESAALIRQEAGAFTGTVQLPPRADVATTRRALAAWVALRGENAPLQAAGGWIE